MTTPTTKSTSVASIKVTSPHFAAAMVTNPKIVAVFVLTIAAVTMATNFFLDSHKEKD